MNTPHATSTSNAQEMAFVGRINHIAEATAGAVAVGAVAVTDSVGHWAATTVGWIMFFLVTKPLWDLSWHWRFFTFAEQGVNLQTFVGLVALGLNGFALWSGALRTRLPRRVLVFLGSAGLSVLLSPSAWGFNEFLRLLTGAAFFYTAGPLLAQPRQFDRFAKALLIVCTLPMVLAFCQLAGVLPYTYWDWIETGRIGRISGGYETPVNVIYLFVFLFPLALYIATKECHVSSVRHAAWALIGTMSIVLAFTYHRVGYVTIAAEVFIWLYLSHRRRMALTLLIALVLVVTLSLSFLKMLYAPLTKSVEEGTNVSSEQFLRGRGIQWYLYIDSYVSSGPIHWIMGLGGSVIPGVLWEDPTDNPLSPNEPHNDYIRILHAYGLVGLALYLSILVAFWRRARQLLRSPNSFARDLARIMLPVIVGVMILSVTTEPMRYPTEVWYFFGLGASLFCVRAEPKSSLFQQSGA